LGLLVLYTGNVALLTSNIIVIYILFKILNKKMLHKVSKDSELLCMHEEAEFHVISGHFKA
jgi:hypothetical protein